MFSTRRARVKLVTIFLLITASASIVFAQQPWAVRRQTEVKYTTSRVNLRSGPGTDSEILHTLSRGESLEFQSVFNANWSAVIYNDTRGFVSSEFLSRERPPEPQVELLDWGHVRTILRTGVTYEVYDVRTGLTYNIRSFSNGNHADVEPVTLEDTAILRRTFNGVWSWDPRPVWITIEGRTIAAAINGMPHGGGVIANNGIYGHICLHFRGSFTHGGNGVYAAQMQNAVTQAYNAAPR